MITSWDVTVHNYYRSVVIVHSYILSYFNTPTHMSDKGWDIIENQSSQIANVVAHVHVREINRENCRENAR